MLFVLKQPKEQGARLNLGFDWTDFLAGDTITTVTIALCANDTSNVALSTAQFSGDDTFCFVSGGTVGQTAKIEHTIQTSGGEIESAVLAVPIVSDC